MTAWNGARRQTWATPWPLFREIERRYSWGGFTVDVAAEEWSAKCAVWIGEEADALSLATPWGSCASPSRAWINPPFDNIDPFVRRAVAEVAQSTCELVVMLVPSRTGQRWYSEIVRPFGRVIDIVGRVAFEPPADYAGEASGGFEDCIVVSFERSLEAGRYTRRREAA
jgi:phage N-6-adenine-methyltransferase